MKTLIAAWLKAKAAEDKARGKRHAVEEELEKLIPGKIDGSVNCLCDDYKITVTRKLIYTVDMDAWNGLPKQKQYDAPVLRKIEVDVKLYKAVFAPSQNNSFRGLVIAKPAKPSIKIERIDK